MRLAIPAAVLTGLLISPAAQACGGFFCDNNQPVIQNAERIAFGIDQRSGMTEAHVQIFYQGPSEDFAWVVPVPDNPDIFISSDALFNQLATQLAPTFQLNIVEEGRCTEGVRLGFAQEMAMNAVADSGGTSTWGSTVDVVQQGQVGPYDMAVLQAQTTDGLLDWLETNGYDLPPALDPVLAPYIADKAYFLALKLQKDKDTGDIAPIGFRYPGDKPAVPIQLTSIAATDDMRLETYIFANERAVPESYLHVRINEASRRLVGLRAELPRRHHPGGERGRRARVRDRLRRQPRHAAWLAVRGRALRPGLSAHPGHHARRPGPGPQLGLAADGSAARCPGCLHGGRLGRRWLRRHVGRRRRRGPGSR